MSNGKTSARTIAAIRKLEALYRRAALEGQPKSWECSPNKINVPLGAIIRARKEHPDLWPAADTSVDSSKHPSAVLFGPLCELGEKGEARRSAVAARILSAIDDEHEALKADIEAAKAELRRTGYRCPPEWMRVRAVARFQYRLAQTGATFEVIPRDPPRLEAVIIDMHESAADLEAQGMPKAADATVPDTAASPQADGYVEQPADPTAYVPMATILAEHAGELRGDLTERRLRTIIEDHATNRIRWTRPLTKDGKRAQNRRHVHLNDWLDWLRRTCGTADGDNLPDPAHVERTKAAMRQRKAAGR